jgi:DNA-binding protein H-NS
MSSYAELKAQAEELLRQAETLRAETRSSVLLDVKESVAEWNFSANELGLKLGLVEKRKSVAKFKDPVSGKTWSGRGRAPDWFNLRLSEGTDRAELLVA